MLKLTYFVFSVYLLFGINSVISEMEIVSRQEWGARAAKRVTKMSNPVSYVVIHHSYSPAACYTKEACIKAMKSIQNYHQQNKGWTDIGYNFGAGSDGRIYTGRGWSAVGAHTVPYNSKSIGICLIGDWTSTVPPEDQLNSVKQLISKGVNEGYIKSDYKLIGHLQAWATSCPGGSLYKEIQTWPNWVANPKK